MTNAAAWASAADDGRPDGLPLDVRQWPDEWRAQLDERVAMMAAPHGDLPDHRARLEAEADVRRLHARETR